LLHPLKGFVASVNDFFVLTGRAIRSIFRSSHYSNDIFMQMDVIGVGSLMIAGMTGFFGDAVTRASVFDPLLRLRHRRACSRRARAMDHATECFAGVSAAIPDRHGEFFIPALTGALDLYRGHVSKERSDLWRERLRAPLDAVLEGDSTHLNNWRTYGMKGEWMRALAYVARNWAADQRDRIASDRYNLYQDHSSDPESHAVEAVGRDNLPALVAAGYNGEYAGKIARAAERGTRVTLLTQDPSGQCPPNGRTDDHVFNDTLYQSRVRGHGRARPGSGRFAPGGAVPPRRAALLPQHRTLAPD